MAERGRQLFARHGCDGCHGAGAAVRAPPLAGLPGSTVTLQDGRRVQADDNYLRDAMLLPGRDVVAGNAPVMPSYAGQLSEEDLLAIIECLRGMQDGR
ncbi:MAG: cytochrome c [Pseudomonadota bacterium]